MLECVWAAIGALFFSLVSIVIRFSVHARVLFVCRLRCCVNARLVNEART